MDVLLRDLRQAFRFIFKNRMMSAATIITLALGIGANTAIFSTVDALVLRPLEVPDLERLVRISDATTNQSFDAVSTAPADYLDWAAQCNSFEGLAAYHYWDSNLTGEGEPERVQGVRVTPSFFPTIGVGPALGRTLLEDERMPGHEHVVVISDGLWRRRYAADPAIVGRSILINDESFTVVGVMPASFKFPQPTQLWVPIPVTNEFINDRSTQYLSVVGRLKGNVSFDQARAEVKTVSARLEQEHPATNRNRTSRLERLRDLASGEYTAEFLWTLMGAVVFVLMIATVNVANIQLARASGRKKEMAIRTALGASRWRVTRQVLTESVVLSVSGGAAGILTASVFIDFIRSSIPPDIIQYIAGWDRLAINPRALLFTLVVAVVTGLLFGLAPAYQGSKSDLNESLKEGGRTLDSGGRRRLRSLLVIGEVALALALLVGAGLMVRGFQRLSRPEGKGFNADEVLTMHVSLNAKRYQGPQQIGEFYRRAIERMESLPGVSSAFAVENIPDAGSWQTVTVLIDGKPVPAPGEDQTANFQTISPGFFRAFQIPILDGRDFSMTDDSGTQRVAIVSTQFAKRYFTGENPIGKRIRVAKEASEWATIVGVAGDVRRFMFDRQPVPAMYVALNQFPARSMFLAARTSVGPETLTNAARSAIYDIDPNQPVYEIKPAKNAIEEQYAGMRLGAMLMLSFGAIALGLAAVGVYGVMSYSVQQRTHEIGVRMALGASNRDVLKMVLRNALLLATIGLAIGLLPAYALSRVMESMLGGMVMIESPIFVAFSVVLMTVALLATYVPARRASRIDPMVALRCE